MERSPSDLIVLEGRKRGRGGTDLCLIGHTGFHGLGSFAGGDGGGGGSGVWI